MGAGITDPVERLYHIHDVMDGSKNSPISQVQYSVQESILPKLPLSIGRQTVFDSFCRHSLIFPMYLGQLILASLKISSPLDVKCSSIIFFHRSKFLSYNERIFMNIILDPVAIPSSENLPVVFRNAILQLLSQSEIASKDKYGY